MKKKIPILFFTLLLLLNYCANAQTYSITKALAFSRQSKAGTIPVDESGRPTSNGVIKDYKIYIETRGTTLPQWQTAVIAGKSYTIRSTEIRESVNLGKLKDQETVAIITKSSGSRLWQLVLTPQTTEQMPSTSNASIPLSLKGTYKGKAFIYKINKVQELAKRFYP